MVRDAPSRSGLLLCAGVASDPERTLGIRVIRSVTAAAWLRGSRTGIGRGSRGVICLVSILGRGRRYGSGTAVTPATGRGTGSWRGFSRRLTPPGGSIGPCRWTRRSPARISMRRTRPAPSRTQGAGSNHKNLPWFEVEPPWARHRPFSWPANHEDPPGRRGAGSPVGDGHHRWAA